MDIFNKIYKSPYLNYSLLIPVISCISFYFFTVWKYAVNVPIVDDYISIIQFLNNYSLAESAIEKFNLLFEPLNMHKILTAKIIAAIVFHYKGHADLRTMVILGNLFLIPCGFYFYHLAKNESKMNSIYLVLLLFIFLNFHYYSFIFLPTVPIQFASSSAFMLGTIFFFTKDKPVHQLTASIFLIISLLSNSNALILIPLGILHHLVSKKIKYLINWIIFCSIALYLYTLNNHGIGQGNGKITYALSNPLIISKWFLVMIGSVSSIRLPKLDVQLPLVFGSIFAAIHTYIIFFKSKGLLKSKPLTYYTYIFFILSSVMISIVRGSDQFLAATSFRYRFIATLLLTSSIILVFSLISNTLKKFFLITTIGLTLLVYYTSMTHYGRIKKFTNELKINMNEYLLDNNVKLHFPNQKIAKKIINKSIDLKVYQPTKKYENETRNR